PSGELEFAVPGWNVTSIDYLVALATGKAPLSEQITLRRISQRVTTLGNPNPAFEINKYLAERGDARVKDWASAVANSKFQDEQTRVSAENAISKEDPRAAAGSLSYLKMQAVLRMVVLKVMYENKIDVFVNPEATMPPQKLGGPEEPGVNQRS